MNYRHLDGVVKGAGDAFQRSLIDPFQCSIAHDEWSDLVRIPSLRYGDTSFIYLLHPCPPTIREVFESTTENNPYCKIHVQFNLESTIAPSNLSASNYISTTAAMSTFLACPQCHVAPFTSRLELELHHERYHSSQSRDNDACMTEPDNVVTTIDAQEHRHDMGSVYPLAGLEGISAAATPRAIIHVNAANRASYPTVSDPEVVLCPYPHASKEAIILLY